MRHGSGIHQQREQLSEPRTYSRRAIALVMLFLASSTWAMQSKPAGQAGRPKSPAVTKATAQREKSPADWQKYSGVLAELIGMQLKLQKELQFPAPRSQSRLLPLLPESTVIFAALPNYGNTLHQAMQVFQREREENPTLRTWWKNDVGADGPKVDNALEKIYQVSQYLGDEIVISAASTGSPVLTILAEVKKPGLKALLQQADKELSTKGRPLRILEPQDLAAAATEHHPGDEPIVLVRPDFVVVAFDVATLRARNSQLDKNNGSFASTSFGQRMMQAYQGGAGIILGLDFQKGLSEMPKDQVKDPAAFQSSGFSDLKYLVWERKDVGSQSTNQMELTFTGPRRAIASWLASPAPLGGLDFVSPKSAMVAALVLKNPAEMFEDIREITTASNPDAFATLAMAEAQVQVNFKQDLLSKLAGEVVIEVDPPVNNQPEWKVALRVNDAKGLQQTLARLLASAPTDSKQREEGGVMFHSFAVPFGPKPLEINYAFVDGYLLIAPSHQAMVDAIQLHRGGGSLAKSAEFHSFLPPGHSAEASGFIYQNLGPFLAPLLQQMSPDMGKVFGELNAEGKPTVMWFYGDNTAIREAHISGTFDMSMMLVSAAVAIPNLQRSKTKANDAAAASSLRTVNTAEITYATTYPKKGYARDLATMGPGSGGDCSGNKISAAHACLLDDALGCSSGTWCSKGGFRFLVTGNCTTLTCSNYVAVATPVNESSGSKSYCSTADAVVRTHTGPLASPVTAAECKKWPPIQ